MANYGGTALKAGLLAQIVTLVLAKTSLPVDWREWVYSEHNITAYDLACRAEIELVDHLRGVLEYLDNDTRKLTERYIQDFEEANHGLRGFSRAGVEGKIQIVTYNPISKIRMVLRIHNYHPRLRRTSLRISYFFPPIENYNFFSEDDVTIALHMIKLLHVYDLNVTQFADGIILNKKTGRTRLNARNCYDLALASMSNAFFTTAIELLQVALEKVDKDGSVERSLLENALEDTLEQHDKKFEECGEDCQAHPYLFDQKILEKRPKEEYKSMRYPRRSITSNPSTKSDVSSWDTCLSGTVQGVEDANAFCWYEFQVDPYWIIQPLKVEQVWEDPDIVQIHGLIQRKTIKRLKARFVQGLPPIPYSAEANHSRNCSLQKVWLAQFQHVYYPEFRSLIKNLEKLSDLHLGLHDPTKQIDYSYYTAGDSDLSHSDFDKKTIKDFAMSDDTVATIQIGLEAPLVKGDIGFHHIRRAVRLSVGSVLFWYSLRRDGAPDVRTSYCDCPVAFGRKWSTNHPDFLKIFLNAVIRVDYRDQFLTKGCGLSPNDRLTTFETPGKIFDRCGG